MSIFFWIFEALSNIFDIVLKLLAGLPVTLCLVAPSIIIGAVLACLLAFMRQSGNVILSSVSRFYVFIFRSIPLLVLLYVIYYGPAQFRKPLTQLGIYWIFLSPWFCAILAFILNTAAYGSEVIRGALDAIPHGQIEAGRACGMSRFTLFKRIIFPIAFRQALPGYSNECILMVKATALVFVVTLSDMTQIAYIMRSKNPLENSTILYCLGALYLILNYGIALVFNKLEQRYSMHLKEASSLSPPPPLAQSL